MLFPTIYSPGTCVTIRNITQEAYWSSCFPVSGVNNTFIRRETSTSGSRSSGRCRILSSFRPTAYQSTQPTTCAALFACLRRLDCQSSVGPALGLCLHEAPRRQSVRTLLLLLLPAADGWARNAVAIRSLLVFPFLLFLSVWRFIPSPSISTIPSRQLVHVHSCRTTDNCFTGLFV